MNAATNVPTSIDGYIQTFPAEVQEILQKLRSIVREVAPEAVEAISYNMPAFKLKGHYISHFAAWKKHISMYPVPAGDAAFQKEIAPYVKAKGTIQFPLDKPIPYELVRKVVSFRIHETIPQNNETT